MDVGGLAANLDKLLDVVPRVLGERELYVRTFRDSHATDRQVARVDDMVTGSGAPVAASYSLPNGDLSYRLAAAVWDAPPQADLTGGLVRGIGAPPAATFDWPDAG